jgi:putative two-component system response regulator
LTDAEWDVMRRHTLIGEEICRPMRTLAPVLCIIRSHHERWDGSGYPDGLRGEEIPLLARLVQLADIYDALISRRPYKLALAPKTALSLIEEEARRGWRQAELVSLLKDVLDTESENTPTANSLLNMQRQIAQLAG